MVTQTDIVVAAGAPLPASPVSWASIFAGGVVAAVATVVLMLLGSGLGLTMVSPWPSQSASAATVVVSAAIWLVVVQWLSSCMGGYITGRLRKRWSSLHSDEVVFRDSAHGLLAWSVATLVVVTVLGSTASGLLGSGLQAASSAMGGAVKAGTETASNAAPNGYIVDSLFRSSDPARINAPGAEGDAAAVGQATRILTTSIANGEMSADDKSYLATLIAARTGLSQADAQKRVDDTWAKAQNAKVKAQEAAEKARKAAATTALLGALSLIIGAFIAAVSAILGGKLRDEDEDRWLLHNQ
ncbi:hypothetical protein ASC80_14990 [Afipia sp. Root123D2]|uniref:hypothetical protein n=1 Tax=Afipia sp. Root123D2 TaxID=1736436 RepID=UPI0006FAAC14|nr:hypothetical protein [Afipia sp. Root123D2]KQW21385.1 hypothetical protein ASC80_14990 [Afipia sp. Root123D2]